MIDNRARALAEKNAASLNENATQTDIKGTTQQITFNGDGTVQKVEHVDSESNIIRTDAFTYNGNTITEVRTHTNGSVWTYVYNLDTYETEVS